MMIFTAYPAAFMLTDPKRAKETVVSSKRYSILLLGSLMTLSFVSEALWAESLQLYLNDPMGDSASPPGDVVSVAFTFDNATGAFTTVWTSSIAQPFVSASGLYVNLNLYNVTRSSFFNDNVATHGITVVPVPVTSLTYMGVSGTLLSWQAGDTVAYWDGNNLTPYTFGSGMSDPNTGSGLADFLGIDGAVAGYPSLTATVQSATVAVERTSWSGVLSLYR